MKSKGVCRSCGKTFSGSGMLRHLQARPERKKLQVMKGKGNVMHLKASTGPFWVYFEMNDSTTLSDIDTFLRDLWLECCGHLSAFTIDSVDYMSDTEFFDSGEKDMNISLKKILKPGMEFIHRYDFGTTTQLDMKCISEREGKVKNRVEILARNDMPEILCDECGEPAKEICTECLWSSEIYLFCEKCAKKHKCDEEMLLPVINSPRTGECGYTGPSVEPDFR